MSPLPCPCPDVCGSPSPGAGSLVCLLKRGHGGSHSAYGALDGPGSPCRGCPEKMEAGTQAAQVRMELERVARKIEAADARRAPYSEIYRLVVMETKLREKLTELEGPDDRQG